MEQEVVKKDVAQKGQSHLICIGSDDITIGVMTSPSAVMTSPSAVMTSLLAVMTIITKAPLFAHPPRTRHLL